jgi:hypothetical protein
MKNHPNFVAAGAALVFLATLGACQPATPKDVSTGAAVASAPATGDSASAQANVITPGLWRRTQTILTMSSPDGGAEFNRGLATNIGTKEKEVCITETTADAFLDKMVGSEECTLLSRAVNGMSYEAALTCGQEGQLWGRLTSKGNFTATSIETQDMIDGKAMFAGKEYTIASTATIKAERVGECPG